MNWFYAKDGQQIGPVEFSEIERLRSEGQLTDDTLVWQQGMANWVKLSDLPKTSTAAPEGPTMTPVPPRPVSGAVQPVQAGATPLPDYGDILCWGILGILLPCAGLAVYIGLIVLHVLEFSAIRKAIAQGRLQESDYSKIHPALFILGLVCCGGICYPLFMYFRNRTGYFKLQPYGVWVAIIAVVLSIGINVALNMGTTALQQGTQ
jgi:hypothetical protein